MPRLKSSREFEYRDTLSAIILGRISMLGFQKSRYREKIGMDHRTLEKKLNDPSQFSDSEMRKIRNGLKIPEYEYRFLESIKEGNRAGEVYHA